MITLHTLNAEDYKKLVAKILFGAEKDENNPYVDSIGHVTIGRGFDIEGSPTPSRSEVFKTMGLERARLDPADPNYQAQLAKEQEYIDSIIATIELYQNTTDSIQRDLNEIMADRAADPVLQTYNHITSRTTFSLTNDEIEQTYQNLIKVYEGRITSLFGDTAVFAESKERA